MEGISKLLTLLGEEITFDIERKKYKCSLCEASIKPGSITGHIFGYFVKKDEWSVLLNNLQTALPEEKGPIFRSFVTRRKYWSSHANRYLVSLGGEPLDHNTRRRDLLDKNLEMKKTENDGPFAIIKNGRVISTRDILEWSVELLQFLIYINNDIIATEKPLDKLFGSPFSELKEWKKEDILETIKRMTRSDLITFFNQASDLTYSSYISDIDQWSIKGMAITVFRIARNDNLIALEELFDGAYKFYDFISQSTSRFSFTKIYEIFKDYPLFRYMKDILRRVTYQTALRIEDLKLSHVLCSHIGIEFDTIMDYWKAVVPPKEEDRKVYNDILTGVISKLNAELDSLPVKVVVSKEPIIPLAPEEEEETETLEEGEIPDVIVPLQYIPPVLDKHPMETITPVKESVIVTKPRIILPKAVKPSVFDTLAEKYQKKGIHVITKTPILASLIPPVPTTRKRKEYTITIPIESPIRETKRHVSEKEDQPLYRPGIDKLINVIFGHDSQVSIAIECLLNSIKRKDTRWFEEQAYTSTKLQMNLIRETPGLQDKTERFIYRYILDMYYNTMLNELPKVLESMLSSIMCGEEGEGIIQANDIFEDFITKNSFSDSMLKKMKGQVGIRMGSHKARRTLSHMGFKL